MAQHSIDNAAGLLMILALHFNRLGVGGTSIYLPGISVKEIANKSRNIYPSRVCPLGYFFSFFLKFFNPDRAIAFKQTIRIAFLLLTPSPSDDFSSQKIHALKGLADAHIFPSYSYRTDGNIRIR
jgi:hypothetical protein